MVVGIEVEVRSSTFNVQHWRVCFEFVAVCIVFVYVYFGTTSVGQPLSVTLPLHCRVFDLQNVVGLTAKGSSDAFKVYRQR